MSLSKVRKYLLLELSGRRKFALVFSDERWRFKIKREHVMSAHLEILLIASPSPYGLDKKGCKEEVVIGRSCLHVASMQESFQTVCVRVSILSASSHLSRLSICQPVKRAYL